MSRTNVRKLAGSFLVIIGLLSIALAYTGCNSLAAVVFLTMASTIQGAVAAGPLANILDISPNYASVIMGLVGMITVAPGFLSPMIVGVFTLNNVSIFTIYYK